MCVCVFLHKIRWNTRYASGAGGTDWSKFDFRIQLSFFFFLVCTRHLIACIAIEMHTYIHTLSLSLSEVPLFIPWLSWYATGARVGHRDLWSSFCDPIVGECKARSPGPNANTSGCGRSKNDPSSAAHCTRRVCKEEGCSDKQSTRAYGCQRSHGNRPAPAYCKPGASESMFMSG